MQAMLKISYEVAKKISELDDGVELFGLDSRDGTEWLLETAEDFDNVADNEEFSFGIEGELFGKPYETEKNSVESYSIRMKKGPDGRWYSYIFKNEEIYRPGVLGYKDIDEAKRNAKSVLAQIEHENGDWNATKKTRIYIYKIGKN